MWLHLRETTVKIDSPTSVRPVRNVPLWASKGKKTPKKQWFNDYWCVPGNLFSCILSSWTLDVCCIYKYMYVFLSCLQRWLGNQSMCTCMYVCMQGHMYICRDEDILKVHHQYGDQYFSCTVYTHIDASYKEVLGSLLQHSTSAPQPSSFCTQGTVHQARAGEAVGVPQAGSSPSSQLWSGWDTKETTGL